MNTDAIYHQNAKLDVLSPCIAMTDITTIVVEMLAGNLAYVKKNGHNEVSKLSRERLLSLLEITETFNTISNQNAALKTYNSHLLNEIQGLRNYKEQFEIEEKLAKSI